MGIKELDLKAAYDSVEDNIVNDFLIPVLSNSLKYYRITGFFSSTALAIAARALFPFINNGGEMKLITSVNLKKKDFQAIKRGLNKPEDFIEDIMLEELEKTVEEDILDHLKLLAWLVANEKLEIKVALREPSVDYDDESITVLSNDLFHQKVGIFIDDENSII